ncbi:L-lactate dehydrogenase (cytochrome) [Candidatus Planktophila sulfonica]|jgi:isopentenyl diphosphate isomerase/L-lactate dehydrogenase-like FMN-dependent dehydrogenase|uniref:L-lactate dehydrogenase (Cytochrome) n=1 Tax=Candidatus Planktophila sulfonica TaxID=1884904 RepID=A0A249KID4_9ACTN|nr:alpha-hydroxy acid oxidase [Candidatus Planktophila sulfonica]ASY16554.1 L-lactate dehydrogenase (cytochrome) [Candidatus Planktophila sulfonica]
MGKNVKRQFPKPSELAPLLQFSLPTLRRKKRRLEKAYTIWDLRDIAKKRTPKGPFDYTDGSAESEVSLERARQAYRDLEFIPSILKDVSTADLTRTALGETFAMPLGIAPTGFTRMMQTEGEIAGARAAEKFGIPFTLSTLGTTTIEDVVASAPGGRNWFQLYMWKDREGSMALVERAKRAGVKNLVLTVDVPAAGQRIRDYRNGLTVPPRLTAGTVINAIPRPAWWINFLTTPSIEFASMKNWEGTVGELLDYMFDPTMTWEDLKWIREQWDGTLTVKGIQNLEDAKMAAKLGADAILLSNHGGRQLDRAPIMLHLLADIKKEFKKDYEIHIDTGIMHGADVLAAVALGAQFTYVGRAYLYGLMAGGQDGVERALEIMRTQMVRNMKLLGVNSLDELTPKHVRFLNRQ